MENLVPLGTGNSRFMKSNISPDTSLAQLIQMLNNGTFPYDIGPINPAGISQQGTPLNKDTLLADLVAQKLGGVETPSEAFDALIQMFIQGKYAFRIFVKHQNGTPLEGATLSGVKDFITNGSPKTDERGSALAYSDTPDITVSVTDNYTDVSIQSVSAQGIIGDIVNVNLVATSITFAAYTATSSARFSSSMSRLDVSLCSAGAGGGSGSSSYGSGGNGGDAGTAKGGTGGQTSSAQLRGGGGGAGGGILIQESVPFEANTDYPVVIGSGGQGGSNVKSEEGYTANGKDGKDGGITTAFGLQASNGSNGGNAENAASYAGSDGGLGGDAGTDGNRQIYASFTEMKTCGTGGPGGAGLGANDSGTGGGGASGGIPGGGGGGGGSAPSDYFSGAGGPGARGEAAFRMWHGEEAT